MRALAKQGWFHAAISLTRADALGRLHLLFQFSRQPIGSMFAANRCLSPKFPGSTILGGASVRRALLMTLDILVKNVALWGSPGLSDLGIANVKFVSMR